MKLFSMILLLLLVSQFAISQNVKKGFEYMDAEKYDKAMDIFRQAIKKKKDKIPSKYGMSLIYFNEKYDQYSYLNAYKNIKSACSYYDHASDKEKKDIEHRFDITDNELNKLKNSIIDTAIAYASREDTEEAYNSFISDFRDEKKKVRQIAKRRNDLAYSAASKIGTYSSFASFIRKYPTSSYIYEAKKTYKKLNTDFYTEFTKDGELRTQSDFDKLYPYFDYPKETKENDKRWAKKASNLDLAIGFRNDKWDANDIMLEVIKYKEYIANAPSTDLAYVALQRLMEPALRNKDWNAAIDTLKNYAPFFGEDDIRIKKLRKILNTSENIEIVSLSNNINTKYHEYAPVMSSDGKTLYFCGKNREDNIGVEDIFKSEYIDSAWSKPVLVPYINSKSGNEAPLSISADGNTLFYFYNSNIFYSVLTKDGWSEKRPFSQVNTETEWEADAMLTSDSKAILFVSDRPGGVGHYRKINDLYHGTYNGNTDIYVIEKTDEGWSNPINLGDVINTFYCDRCPFLHPDMKTLYFSSEGHGGMGRLDIYKSTRLSDTSWTQWSEPVHLGREVNTTGDDWGYKITTDGKYAYFALTTDKNYDISMFELPTHYRPEMIATLSGKVKTTNILPENSKIVWEDLNTGEHIGDAAINPMDNTFFITLPLGKEYGFHIEAKGFFPLSKHLNLKEKNKGVEIKEDFEGISINEILNGKKGVRLNNLFFEHDKYEIKPQSYAELDRIADFLITNGFQSTEIAGYTDDTGATNYNVTLSENRAKSVRDYLVSKGCSPDLFLVKGYGKEHPTHSNETEEGRAMNRRVEIKIHDTQ